MEYIDREAFLAEQRHLYCENCARRKNGKGKFVYGIGDAPCRACDICDVLDAVEDAPTADVGWIPVTERLPEDGSLVGKLIADSDGNIRIASQCAEITLSGGKTVYTDLIDLVSLLAEDTPTTEWEDCTRITHWMQLPEPPKEET